MSLRFPKVQPSWAYRDPAEFVRFETSALTPSRASLLGEIDYGPPAAAPRDRYYTQERRLHVKQLMKGKA